MTPASVLYPSLVAPRKAEPELRLLGVAAKEAGVGEATIYRWLKAGLLQRYYTTPPLRRRTMIDIRELRRLRENPPGELAEPKPDEPAGEA